VAGYATLFYPGTTDPGQAQPIDVGPGEVRDNLMFRIGYVPVARVSGFARRPDGSPLAMTTISMRHREMKASLEGSGWSARTDAEGRFTFQSVPPGDYRMSARAQSSPAVKALDLWGQTDVVVAGDAIEGIGLMLGPASTIAGRIQFDGKLKPPDNLGVVRLQVIAAEALAMTLSGAPSPSLSPVQVQADGTFKFEGLPPDQYFIAASWPGMRTGDGTQGWWITSIRVGARELGDALIDVAPNASVADVAITFSDRIGAIEGRLTDAAGRPVPDYYVVAFPVERASWTSLSRKIVPPARPGTDGQFRLIGLMPGEYYLAVVTAMDADDNSDPAFLEAILGSAIKLTIGAGETKRQDLKIGK
jgi:hypothetical protein